MKVYFTDRLDHDINRRTRAAGRQLIVLGVAVWAITYGYLLATEEPPPDGQREARWERRGDDAVFAVVPIGDEQ